MAAAIPYLMGAQVLQGLYSSKRAGDYAETAADDAKVAEETRKNEVKAKDAIRETGHAEKQTTLRTQDPYSKTGGFATSAKETLTIPGI
tara:strand:- start:974 stop:1240 length:267 start_codon:yes stop_codon:yes gene_type:complete